MAVLAAIPARSGNTPQPRRQRVQAQIQLPHAGKTAIEWLEQSFAIRGWAGLMLAASTR